MTPPDGPIEIVGDAVYYSDFVETYVQFISANGIYIDKVLDQIYSPTGCDLDELRKAAELLYVDVTQNILAVKKFSHDDHKRYSEYIAFQYCTSLLKSPEIEEPELERAKHLFVAVVWQASLRNKTPYAADSTISSRDITLRLEAVEKESQEVKDLLKVFRNNVYNVKQIDREFGLIKKEVEGASDAVESFKTEVRKEIGGKLDRDIFSTIYKVAAGVILAVVGGFFYHTYEHVKPREITSVIGEVFAEQKTLPDGFLKWFAGKIQGEVDIKYVANDSAINANINDIKGLNSRIEKLNIGLQDVLKMQALKFRQPIGILGEKLATIVLEKEIGYRGDASNHGPLFHEKIGGSKVVGLHLNFSQITDAEERKYLTDGLTNTILYFSKNDIGDGLQLARVLKVGFATPNKPDGTDLVATLSYAAFGDYMKGRFGPKLAPNDIGHFKAYLVINTTDKAASVLRGVYIKPSGSIQVFPKPDATMSTPNHSQPSSTISNS